MKIIKETTSICPTCLKNISAKIVEENGKIYLTKKCDIHGEFKDIYYSDEKCYSKFMKYDSLKNKNINFNESIKNCPKSCGICENHKSSTVLANLEITNKCNYKCPVCFANSDVANYNYHPSIEKISEMMDTLRNQNPPNDAIQLSGGEPTIRKDFFEIIKMARSKGFIQVQVATNGKIIADDPNFAIKLANADIDTIYLQFDGVTPEPFIEVRGFNALPQKIKAIENMRKAGKRPHVVLVPTIIKGVNDHQIGDIIRFAAENIDIIRGVNFQPISYTGRISNQELMNRRITVPDILNLAQKQLKGEILAKDFFPVSAASPVLEYIQLLNKNIQLPILNTHPACGAWSFVYKFDNILIPLDRIINLKNLFKLVSSLKTTKISEIVLKIIYRFYGLFRFSSLKYLHKIIFQILRVLRHGSMDSISNFSNNQHILFIGTMHFMDPYNLDFERLERCCIHNVAPDGSVIPFCAYNIFYREKLEKEYSNLQKHTNIE